MMYVVEGEENGFTASPLVYWAIVTMTTVGFGDVAPRRRWGSSWPWPDDHRLRHHRPSPRASSPPRWRRPRKDKLTQACPACGAEGHDLDARFCKYCGVAL